MNIIVKSQQNENDSAHTIQKNVYPIHQYYRYILIRKITPDKYLDVAFDLLLGEILIITWSK